MTYRNNLLDDYWDLTRPPIVVPDVVRLLGYDHGAFQKTIMKAGDVVHQHVIIELICGSNPRLSLAALYALGVMHGGMVERMEPVRR